MSIDESTERELVELSAELTTPHPDECLGCYLDQMLTEAARLPRDPGQVGIG
jgi:hypothetical protein